MVSVRKETLKQDIEGFTPQRKHSWVNHVRTKDWQEKKIIPKQKDEPQIRGRLWSLWEAREWNADVSHTALGQTHRSGTQHRWAVPEPSERCTGAGHSTGPSPGTRATMTKIQCVKIKLWGCKRKNFRVKIGKKVHFLYLSIMLHFTVLVGVWCSSGALAADEAGVLFLQLYLWIGGAASHFEVWPSCPALGSGTQGLGLVQCSAPWAPSTTALELHCFKGGQNSIFTLFSFRYFH